MFFVVGRIVRSSFRVPRLYSTLSHKVKTGNMEGITVNWDLTTLTPQDVEEKKTEIINKLKAAYDGVAETHEVSYKTVLEPLLEASRWYLRESSLLTFPRQVVQDKELREAASAATQVLEDATVDQSMRIEVFNKLVEYQKQNPVLSPELDRALQRLIKNGRRNGLHLSEEIRVEVTGIMKRVNELGLKFSRNLSENNEILLFTKEELAGVPKSFIQGLAKDENGNCEVTLNYPHFFPVTRKCRVPETRRRMETAFNARCREENTVILEEILELRQREALLLGYPNHAAYAQELLMSQNPERVNTFLTDLGAKLKPLWEKERIHLLKMKKEESEKYGYDFNGKLDPWDIRYFNQRVEEEEFAVNQDELMKYFPLGVVTDGLLSIYQQLLSVTFVPLENAPKWHDEVQVYQVNDAVSSDLLGFFFLDLHPREGKYGHACCCTLQLGCGTPDGKREPAVVAMLCNFTRPQNGKPALLDHKEVETYFHEFGHVMHTICSKAETALFAGAHGVERDFVECPSQMLENWVWEKEPLRRMSQHYLTKAPIPDDLLEKLVGSQKANAGGLNLKQVLLAMFDQKVHSGGRCDTQAVFAQAMNDIMGLDAIPDTNMAATFNHIAIGYSARYYSYLWSEVFSMDMFKTRFGEGSLMDPGMGLLYRQHILEPGGSLDANEMLKNFLGRAPKPEPFLESKGLSL